MKARIQYKTLIMSYEWFRLCVRYVITKATGTEDDRYDLLGSKEEWRQ